MLRWLKTAIVLQTLLFTVYSDLNLTHKKDAHFKPICSVGMLYSHDTGSRPCTLSARSKKERHRGQGGNSAVEDSIPARISDSLPCFVDRVAPSDN